MMLAPIVKDVFGTEQGQRLLNELKDLSFRESPRDVEKTNDFIYAEGRRSLVRDLINLYNYEETTNE